MNNTNKIIQEIRDDKNPYYTFSHFEAGNMKDYSLLQSTINDIATVYNINIVDAVEIVNALIH